MTNQEILKHINTLQKELEQLKKYIINQESKWAIYYHLLPNGKYYIGIAKDTKQRWLNGEGYRANTEFYNAIKEYGWGNIQHTIIQYVDTEKEARRIETLLIYIYNSSSEKYGYNKSSFLGNIGINEEARQKEKALILETFYLNVTQLEALEKAYQNRKGE